MARALWVVQGLLSLIVMLNGGMKLVLPPGAFFGDRGTPTAAFGFGNGESFSQTRWRIARTLAQVDSRGPELTGPGIRSLSDLIGRYDFRVKEHLFRVRTPASPATTVEREPAWRRLVEFELGSPPRPRAHDTSERSVRCAFTDRLLALSRSTLGGGLDRRGLLRSSAMGLALLMRRADRVAGGNTLGERHSAPDCTTSLRQIWK